MSDFRRVLYDLKRQYGENLVVQWTAIKTTNPQTGKIVDAATARIHYPIRRGIAFPPITKRAYRYVPGDKFQGFVEVANENIRQFIIEFKDLPIELKKYHSIIYRDQLYDIKEIETIENLAYLITTSNIPNVLSYAVKEVQVTQSVEIQQGATNEP